MGCPNKDCKNYNRITPNECYECGWLEAKSAPATNSPAESGESAGLQDGVDAIVYYPGDPSVGIFSAQWDIKGGFIFEDEQDRKDVRKYLEDAFECIMSDTCHVQFTDEIEHWEG